jgi:glycosyltransferase involved in cell wall biosynthesis
MIRKLAIISPFQNRYPRGVERFSWELGCAFVGRGVGVDILTWAWPNPCEWGEAPPGLRVRRVPYFRYYPHHLAVPFYASWLARGGYDWVMVYWGGYGEAAALRLSRLVRRQRVCLVLHFPREQVPYRYNEFEWTGLARDADLIVGVSEYVTRGARAQFERPCATVDNGVDPRRFDLGRYSRQAARRELGVDENTPVLVSVTALEERKGIQWILRALPRLFSEFPDLHYWVLGEGSHREALEAEAALLGLGRHVRFLGPRKDVPAVLAGADVGCLLSYGEAFPLAMLEYLAMKLPVVTSRHPPFDSLVRTDWGLMTYEKDSEGVAAALAALLRNPDRRRAMGQAGREHVLSHYTWERAADEYLSLFDASTTDRAPGAVAAETPSLDTPSVEGGRRR